mgnify:FL=1
MAHSCSDKTCLFVNRDGTIVCRETGKCQAQFICSNEYKVETKDLFSTIERLGIDHKHTKRSDNSPVISHDNIKLEVAKYVKLLLYSKARNDISANTDPLPSGKKQKRHYKKRRKVAILDFDTMVFDTICRDVSEIIIK